MPYPDAFTGFQVKSAETWTEFHKLEFTPKPFGDFDVDIRIEACGVCASDLHTINGDWGNDVYPLCAGHEIVGTALRVGPKVSLVREGQRVGVGAQIWSCLECRQCRGGNENYCRHQVDTYGAQYPHIKDVVTQGGYSSHVRAHEHWVFPIPDALPSTTAAPMLCAGITTYSPLVRNGCGPGKKVGIVGVGGLGHFGVQFAKALGADSVWAISRSRVKEADALAMGATGLIATDEPGWADADSEHSMSFDLIVNTANSFEGLELSKYLSLLDVGGRWVSVGLPPSDQSFSLTNKDFVPNAAMIGASHIGSRSETLAMLQLAADKGIKTWVEEVPISAKGLSEAVQRLHKHDVHYRFCLTGFDKAFGDC
jgi:alcohol dehydrogenase (NADP+)